MRPIVLSSIKLAEMLQIPHLAMSSAINEWNGIPA